MFRSLRTGSSHPESFTLQRSTWKKDTEDAYLCGSKQVVVHPSSSSVLHKIYGFRELVRQRFTSFPANKAGRHRTDTSLRRNPSHSRARYINKFLNVIICGSVLGLGCIFIFEYLMAKFIRYGPSKHFNFKKSKHTNFSHKIAFPVTEAHHSECICWHCRGKAALLVILVRFGQKLTQFLPAILFL